MKICGALSLFVVILVATGAGATGEELPGPCREWLQPCLNGRWVCTSEYTYQRSLHSLQPGCPASEDVPTPPPGLQCRVINDTCQYTDSDLECATWVPDCQFSYTCGSVQERDQASNQTNCGHLIGQTLPLPDTQCLPINNTCQWYNPCYYWRGYCGGTYQCGNANEYYSFEFGPHPLCAPPPEGWGEVVPPGECVIQHQQCEWSNCTAYLDWCRTAWTCGSQYDHAVYLAGPPPPCPAPPPGYTPPPQPGLCRFNIEADQCRFEIIDTPTSGINLCECPGVYYDTGESRECVIPDECGVVIVDDPCVLGLVICPDYDDQCIPDSTHPDGAYCFNSHSEPTPPVEDSCILGLVQCPDGNLCVPDFSNPNGAVCLTPSDDAPYSGPCESLSGTQRRGPNPRTLCLLTCSNFLGSDICTPSECACPQGNYFDDRFGRGCVPPQGCYQDVEPTPSVDNSCVLQCPDEYFCVPDSAHPDGAVCLTMNEISTEERPDASLLEVAVISGISVGIVIVVCVVLAVVLGLILLVCCRKQRHVKAPSAVVHSSDECKKADSCKYSKVKCEESLLESSLEKELKDIDVGFVPEHTE